MTFRLQYKCILYFQEHPNEYQTLSAISDVLGADVNRLEHTVDQLVKQSILERKVMEDVLYYRYIRPKDDFTGSG